MKTIEAQISNNFMWGTKGIKKTLRPKIKGVISIDNKCLEHSKQDMDAIKVNLSEPLDFETLSKVISKEKLHLASDSKQINIYDRNGYFPGEELIKIYNRNNKPEIILMPFHYRELIVHTSQIVDNYLELKYGKN